MTGQALRCRGCDVPCPQESFPLVEEPGVQNERERSWREARSFHHANVIFFGNVLPRRISSSEFLQNSGGVKRKVSLCLFSGLGLCILCSEHCF